MLQGESGSCYALDDQASFDGKSFSKLQVELNKVSRQTLMLRSWNPHRVTKREGAFGCHLIILLFLFFFSPSRLILGEKNLGSEVESGAAISGFWVAKSRVWDCGCLWEIRSLVLRFYLCVPGKPRECGSTFSHGHCIKPLRRPC